MPSGIDPKVDCAFKKLFGSEENEAIPIDLLSAVLGEEVADAESFNRYEREWGGEKRSRAAFTSGWAEDFLVEQAVRGFEFLEPALAPLVAAGGRPGTAPTRPLTEVPE